MTALTQLILSILVCHYREIAKDLRLLYDSLIFSILEDNTQDLKHFMKLLIF